MWPVWILVAAVVLATALAYRIEGNRIPQKRERFRQRKELSLAQIYHQYFAANNIDQSRFEDLWVRLSKLLRLDPLKLLPTDRFDRELSPVEGYLAEDELADVEDFYVEEARKIGISDNQAKPETIGDFITILAPPR